MELQRTELMS